jgi:hydrogenase maturation protease
VLVVGVGSLLRTDDAVGRVVAERLEALHLDGVEVASVHQLTPELAPGFAGRRLVVIVDAAVDVRVDVVSVSPIEIDASGELMTHHLGPGGLLSFAAKLGWRPERAVAVRIPVRELGMGTELSAQGAALVEQALIEVQALVR